LKGKTNLLAHHEKREGTFFSRGKKRRKSGAEKKDYVAVEGEKGERRAARTGTLEGGAFSPSRREREQTN